MRFLFCCEPGNIRKPDPDYEEEVGAITRLGAEFGLIDFEALVYETDARRCVRAVAQAERPETDIFRGWMMTPPAYREFYDALGQRGVYLINTPDAYQHCHYLPESYAVIEAHTPKTVWVKMDIGQEIDIDCLMELLHPFDSRPVIVKDFVKSRKHEWEEACFIPSSADRRVVERVVRRFLELQGDNLNEGLVFREFIEFEPLTHHSKSGMPLTKEFRLFFLDGESVFATRYWDEGEYGDAMPPVEQFEQIAKNVNSRFFTMDVAKQREGDWMIVELGDAQVAGLPEHVEPDDFYGALSKRLIQG